jgi:hypothetical protein
VSRAIPERKVPNQTAKQPKILHPNSGLVTESRVLAVTLFALYMLIAIYLTFDLHYYAGDALSRVANAYYVLFGRNPHLGAIGFIWNPLPSLFELPIVALYPLFPAVVTKGVAAFVVSASFGAWGAVNLNHIFKGFGVHNPWRIALTLLYALNPLIALYGANGMSDIMLVACTMGIYSGVFDYLYTGSLRRLIHGGIWMALGLGMRYEAVPIGALIIFGLMAAQWGKTSATHWKGSAILLGAPIVFVGGLWTYFNWLIMKNPLYFLNSNYGNLAQTKTGTYLTPALLSAYHNIIGSLEYVAHFTLFFWPLSLVFIVTLTYCFGPWRDAHAPILIGGTMGAVALEFGFAYLGHLGSWDRYFISFIPNGMLMTVFLTSKMSHNLGKHWRQVLWILATLMVVSGDIGTVWALQNPALGHPDGQIIDSAWQGRSMKQLSDPFSSVELVIQYIDAHPHVTVLADSFYAWDIIVRADNLKKFVITSNYNFAAILHNPRGRVSAILVPRPVGVANLDAVNIVWPHLWSGQVGWAHLIKSFPDPSGWKLYAVTSRAP